MKLVTYNLHFGGKNCVHWNEIIAEFDPELLCVQESFAPVEHLPSVKYGSRHEQAVWTRVKRDEAEMHWGSGVYSKSYRPVILNFPEYRGWVVGAEIGGFCFLDQPPRRLRVISLHAPSGRGAYTTVVNAILDQLSALSDDGDLVIAGDFNLTVSPRHESETQLCGPADLKIQARLRDEFGLVNCWERSNPGVPLAQTLRWVSRPELPFHCDGIFVPPHWAERLKACTVAAADRWVGMSDHNPVVAEFA